MANLIIGQPLGKPLLDLTLATTRGDAQLKDFLGHGLVIYFYPKDDTPGCTVEGKDFSARHQDFLAADTQVIGVSRDSLASHQKFIAKHGLTITLVSDADESICKAFGVIKEKNMYGKKVMGIERSTFLIDAQGVLKQSWRGVKVPGHVDEVLAAAEH
ncbi:MAG: peroxiredoxin [Burkholderiaceae bacterium]|nr:peroxiredoxin [Burkholderiaceae bacterium]